MGANKSVMCLRVFFHVDLIAYMKVLRVMAYHTEGTEAYVQADEL